MSKIDPHKKVRIREFDCETVESYNKAKVLAEKYNIKVYNFSIPSGVNDIIKSFGGTFENLTKFLDEYTEVGMKYYLKNNFIVGE